MPAAAGGLGSRTAATIIQPDKLKFESLDGPISEELPLATQPAENDPQMSASEEPPASGMAWVAAWIVVAVIAAAGILSRKKK